MVAVDELQLSLELPPDSKTFCEILVGDPWDFVGPDGQNRVLTKIIGIKSSQSPKEKDFILLEVLTPFIHEGDLVKYMIAFPRHTGDTTYEIIKIGGSVNIYRIRPKFDIQKLHLLKSDDVEHFLIAGISPQK